MWTAGVIGVPKEMETKWTGIACKILLLSVRHFNSLKLPKALVKFHRNLLAFPAKSAYNTYTLQPNRINLTREIGRKQESGGNLVLDPKKAALLGLNESATLT